MSKHTQGPWKIRSNFIDAGLDIIAEVNPTVDKMISNAHLIAAAPEMLEALEFYANGDNLSFEEKINGKFYLLAKQDIDNIARQVIKKAKGQ